jgi:alpha-galactosidase
MNSFYKDNVFFVIWFLSPFLAFAQKGAFVKWDDQGLLLNNGVVSRYLSFNDKDVRTISLRIPDVERNFVQAQTAEPRWLLNELGNLEEARGCIGHDPLGFSFTLDNKELTRLSGWKITNIKTCVQNKGEGATLTLEGHGLNLQITYLLYPNFPVIRKKIWVTNLSGKEIKLENFDVESLNISWENAHNVIYNNYMRYKRLGPFTGDWDDPVVAVQDRAFPRGILLGNEAPGVMKRTSVCLDDYSLSVGLTHSGQDYPFRVWMKDGEKWESSWTFIIPYQGVDPA